MRVHEIKLQTEELEHIKTGERPVLIIRNDANYQKGDHIRFTAVSGFMGLASYDQPIEEEQEITCVLSGGGLKEDFVTLCFRPCKEEAPVKADDADDGRRTPPERDVLYKILTACAQTAADKEAAPEEIAEHYADILEIIIENNISCGSICRTDSFAKDVTSGFFTEYDGVGYMVGKDWKETDKKVPFSVAALEKMKEEYPWVIWYNR